MTDDILVMTGLVKRFGDFTAIAVKAVTARLEPSHYPIALP